MDIRHKFYGPDAEYTLFVKDGQEIVRMHVPKTELDGLRSNKAACMTIGENVLGAMRAIAQKHQAAAEKKAK